jgi:hypothetical protein
LRRLRSARRRPGSPSASEEFSDGATASRKWPFKPDRLDKIVALIVGVALALAVLWTLIRFFLGFLSGLLGG